jgi:hypothetical protein
MLKLPLNRINKLINSLEGEFVANHPQISCYTWFNKVPIILTLCITKDSNPNKPDDLYYLYILDLYCLNTVGQKASIYSYSHANWFVVNTEPGLYFKYKSNIRHAQTGSKLSVSWNPYSNKNEDKELNIKYCVVEKSLRLFELLTPYYKKIIEGVNTKYEQWIMDYWAKLEFLEYIWNPCSFKPPFTQVSNVNCYVEGIQRVEAQLLKDLDELVKLYPEVVEAEE